MTDMKDILGDEILNDPKYTEALERALKEADAPVVETFTRSHHVILARPSGYWNNTGVYKPKGIALRVTCVGGAWRSNPHWGPTDGAGDGRYAAGPTYLKQHAAEGSCVGKVGGNNTGGGSPVIAIGNHGYISPDLEGLVWLTVNDEPAGFGDNHGSITVRIEQSET